MNDKLKEKLKIMGWVVIAPLWIMALTMWDHWWTYIVPKSLISWIF